MENSKVFALYEKYLASGSNTDNEDDSDIDLSFGNNLFENFATTSKTPSKGRRRSSVSPLNSTVTTKTSIEKKVSAAQAECQMNTILTNLLRNNDNLEILSDIRTTLSQLGDENVLKLMNDLYTDFNNKQEQEPMAFAEQTKQKYKTELAQIRQLLENETSRFAQEMAIVEQQNFKDIFKMDATLHENTDLDAKANELKTNMSILQMEVCKINVCKDLGLIRSNGKA